MIICSIGDHGVTRCTGLHWLSHSLSCETLSERMHARQTSEPRTDWLKGKWYDECIKEILTLNRSLEGRWLTALILSVTNRMYPEGIRLPRSAFLRLSSARDFCTLAFPACTFSSNFNFSAATLTYVSATLDHQYHDVFGGALHTMMRKDAGGGMWRSELVLDCQLKFNASICMQVLLNPIPLSSSCVITDPCPPQASFPSQAL